MDSMSFERFIRALATAASRRDLIYRALTAVLATGLANLRGPLQHARAVETLSDPGSSHRRRRRRTRHRHRNGQHSHHRPGQQQKTCSKSGEIPHKGKPCCKGLIRDGTGTCAVENTACDVCASGCPGYSLQAAIDAAAPGDTIRLCAGTFGSAEIGIDLTLDGAGDGDGGTNLTRMSTDLAAAAAGRIVRVLPGTTVELRNLRISGGLAELGIGATAARGGGIENEGNLRLVRVTVTDNEAVDRGGGIYNGVGAVLTLEQSVIRRNRVRSTDGDGGGLYNDTSGNVVFTDSLVELNTAGRNGGGIYTAPGGEVRLTATRVTTNTAGGGGGGFFNDGGTVTGVNPTDVHGNVPTDCSGADVPGCPAPL